MSRLRVSCLVAAKMRRQAAAEPAASHVVPESQLRLSSRAGLHTSNWKLAKSGGMGQKVVACRLGRSLSRDSFERRYAPVQKVAPLQLQLQVSAETPARATLSFTKTLAPGSLTRPDAPSLKSLPKSRLRLSPSRQKDGKRSAMKPQRVPLFRR